MKKKNRAWELRKTYRQHIENPSSFILGTFATSPEYGWILKAAVFSELSQFLFTLLSKTGFQRMTRHCLAILTFF